MKTITVGMLATALLLSVGSSAYATAGKGLEGRIEITCHEKSFTMQFHIRNTTKTEIKVIRGRGAGGIAEAPFLRWAGYLITPPTYVRNYRGMQPEYVTVPAESEVLYGSFTMGYPPDTDLSKEWEVFSALNIHGEIEEGKRYFSIKSQTIKIHVDKERKKKAQQSPAGDVLRAAPEK